MDCTSEGDIPCSTFRKEGDEDFVVVFVDRQADVVQVRSESTQSPSNEIRMGQWDARGRQRTWREGNPTEKTRTPIWGIHLNDWACAGGSGKGA